MRSIKIQFAPDQLPPLSELWDRLIKLTGLQFDFEVEDGFFWIITHPSKPSFTVAARLEESNEFELGVPPLMPIGFVSGSIMFVLMEMGGEIDFEVPDWAGISYQEAQRRGLEFFDVF